MAAVIFTTPVANAVSRESDFSRSPSVTRCQFRSATRTARSRFLALRPALFFFLALPGKPSAKKPDLTLRCRDLPSAWASSVFAASSCDLAQLVGKTTARPAGLEPTTTGLEGLTSIADSPCDDKSLQLVAPPGGASTVADEIENLLEDALADWRRGDTRGLRRRLLSLLQELE